MKSVFFMSFSVCPFRVEIHISHIISRVGSCLAFLIRTRVLHHKLWMKQMIKNATNAPSTLSIRWGMLVCFSDGRHSLGLFCFSCQESWDGWKLTAFLGTFHHVYFLTGSLYIFILWTDLFGKISRCLADLQLFPGSLAPSCLWATYMQVPGPCLIWCVNRTVTPFRCCFLA